MQRALIAVVATVAALLAAVLIWFNVVRDDAPDRFELSDDTEETEATGAAEEGAGADAPPSEAAGDAEPGDGSGIDELSGTWLVGDGSEAGYRVVEDLGNIQDFEAVGRTSDVTGSIEIEGSTVQAGSFEVTIASIVSDDQRRDRAFTEQVMSADEFPTAGFTLTSPIELGQTPAEGQAVSASTTGDLTLRGRTNPVTFDVQAQLIDGRIEIVGSVPVLFSDYGIANPSNPIVSVRDEGLVEVRLLLDRS